MPTTIINQWEYNSVVLPIVLVVVLIGVLVLLRRNKQYDQNKTGTPTLDRYSRDLTLLARQGKLDPVIGRENEIERTIQVLSRRTKNNPVLVGKPGVGKTAIAEGLAQVIVNKKVPSVLRDKRVLALDLPALLAGTKYRGEFEQRLKHITDEITAAQRSIVLFIDEIHTLAEAGSAEGAVDADDILKPALARGDLQVIGATTVEEYHQFIEKDITLDRRLHPILVDEPTMKETVAILRGIKRKYEQFHQVTISDDAINTAVKLAAKYITDKSFPDKAIDLMDEAAAKIRLAAINQNPDTVSLLVDATAVTAVMAEWQQDQVKQDKQRK